MSEELDFLRDLMDERDRRYSLEFQAVKELSNTRFESAKQAVDKALVAQEGVNIRQNEFRGQLSDQAATLMPRKETETMVEGIRESIARVNDEMRRQVDAMRDGNRLLYDGLKSEIVVLQKQASEGQGREKRGAVGTDNTWRLVTALIAAVSALGAWFVLSLKG